MAEPNFAKYEYLRELGIQMAMGLTTTNTMLAASARMLEAASIVADVTDFTVVKKEFKLRGLSINDDETLKLFCAALYFLRTAAIREETIINAIKKIDDAEVLKAVLDDNNITLDEALSTRIDSLLMPLKAASLN